MTNTTKTYHLPDLNKALPLTLQNLALQAFPDGSIAVMESEEGWCVALARPELTAILVTDRKSIKYYASLDTAIRQLEKIGITSMIVRPKGKNQ